MIRLLLNKEVVIIDISLWLVVTASSIKIATSLDEKMTNSPKEILITHFYSVLIITSTNL